MSRDRDEFIAVLCEAYLALPERGQTCNVLAVVESARSIMRLGREMKTACERYCNEPMPEGWFEKKTKSVGQRMNRIAEHMGTCCKPIFQQDPRGYTVRLKLSTGRTNTFAGDGWGVPTS